MDDENILAPTDSNLEQLVRKKTRVKIHFNYGVTFLLGTVCIDGFDDESLSLHSQEEESKHLNRPLSQKLARSLVEFIELL